MKKLQSFKLTGKDLDRLTSADLIIKIKDPNEDYRDGILRFLFEKDIVPGAPGTEQKPNYNYTEIQQAINDINARFPHSITANSMMYGISASIQTHSKDGLRKFLDGGGFTKIEYDKPITDEEKVKVLQEMKEKGSIDLRESDKSRLRKVLDALVVEEYSSEVLSAKGHNGYKCTDLGNRSAKASRLLPGKLLAIGTETHNYFAPVAKDQGSIIDMGKKNKIEGSQIGNENKQETKIVNPADSKKWYEQSWAKWAGAVLAGLAIAYLSHLLWPGSCN